MDLRARERAAGRAVGIAERLTADEVAAVAITWVDNAGITRVKAIPVAGLEHASAWGVGMSPVFDTFLPDDTITMGNSVGGPTGDLRLHPDLDALTALAGQPGWAWAPADRYTQDAEPYPGDQRGFTRRMVERATAAGVEVQMGFEIEWALAPIDPEDPAAGGFTPACHGPAYGMTRIIELSDYCRDLFRALADQSVPVGQIHPEYTPGQFEVSTGPADPVTAADRSVLVRQTVRAVGQRHKLRTSFAPAVVAGTVGNGGHLHLSVRRDGRNLFTGGPGPHGLTAEGESFLAGVLAHLPALCAIGAPSVASYLRLVPSRWAGAYQVWGRENREAALRLVTGSVGERGEAANAELKSFDPSANPYLAAGAVLAVGLANLDTGMRLPEEVTVDPATLDDPPPRLPETLGDALTHLERDPLLREAFGEPLYDAFTAVRRAEIAAYDGKSADEVVAATRWRY